MTIESCSVKKKMAMGKLSATQTFVNHLVAIIGMPLHTSFLDQVSGVSRTRVKKVQLPFQFSPEEEGTMFYVYHVASVNKVSSVQYVDSGCSNHMTSHESYQC